MLPEHIYCLLAVRRHHDLIAPALESFSRHPAHDIFVVDEQYGSRSRFRFGRLYRTPIFGGLVRRREEHAKSRAHIRRCFQLDAASVGADDARYRCQPKAAAGEFSSEKWVEDAAPDLVGNAGAGIAHY